MAEVELNRIKEMNRLRQQRYYYAHKNLINQKHKDRYYKNISNKPVIIQKVEVLNTEVLPTTSLVNIVSNLKMNPEINSIETRNKYISDISTIFNILNTDNLSIALKNANNILKKLKNAVSSKGTVYSNNSIRNFLQVILFLTRNYDTNISNLELKKLINAHEQTTIQAVFNTQIKQEEQSVMLLDDYIELVSKEYPGISKEFVLVSLYKEVTARDDFGKLIIIPTTKELNKIDNFIIFPRDNRNCKIILNSYKTSAKYGIINIELSPELSKLIRAYIFKNGLEYNDYLFGKASLLSGFIGKINKSINVNGSINTIRQMKISSELLTLNDIQDMNKRITLSKTLMHSPVTNLIYLRTIKV